MFYVADMLVTTNTNENSLFTGYFEKKNIYFVGRRLIHNYKHTLDRL